MKGLGRTSLLRTLGTRASAGEALWHVGRHHLNTFLPAALGCYGMSEWVKWEPAALGKLGLLLQGWGPLCRTPPMPWDREPVGVLVLGFESLELPKSSQALQEPGFPEESALALSLAATADPRELSSGELMIFWQRNIYISYFKRNCL